MNNGLLEDEDVVVEARPREKEKWMPTEMRKPRKHRDVEALKDLYRAKGRRPILGRLKQRLVRMLALLPGHKALTCRRVQLMIWRW